MFNVKLSVCCTYEYMYMYMHVESSKCHYVHRPAVWCYAFGIVAINSCGSPAPAAHQISQRLTLMTSQSRHDSRRDTKTTPVVSPRPHVTRNGPADCACVCMMDDQSWSSVTSAAKLHRALHHCVFGWLVAGNSPQNLFSTTDMLGVFDFTRSFYLTVHARCFCWRHESSIICSTWHSI